MSHCCSTASSLCFAFLLRHVVVFIHDLLPALQDSVFGSADGVVVRDMHSQHPILLDLAVIPLKKVIYVNFSRSQLYK